LWRKAVLAYWQHRDPISGTVGDENLECHHIVSRRKYVLRWDYRNAIPATHETHRWIHQNPVAAHNRLIELVDFDHLEEMERWTKPDFLFAHGWSDDEFRLHLKGDLEKIIERYSDEVV
jgi:hypothetical protein